MRSKTTLLLACALVLGACDDDATGPAFGGLRIVTVTSGADFDENGYELKVGENVFTVLANGIREVDGLPVGRLPVSLAGLASNCDPEGGSAATVTIERGRTVEAVVRVVCYGTGIELGVVTTGLDPDLNGFLAQVGSTTLQLWSNGTVAMSRMNPGSYQVSISGVAPNCNVLGGTQRVVEVVARQVTTLSVTVVCVAAFGIVDITVKTSGPDQDLNGYLVRVGSSATRIPPSATARVSSVDAGTFLIQLEDVVSNCVTEGGNATQITVTAGGLTRDTVRVRFDVTCTRTQKIAFAQNNAVGHISVNDLTAFTLVSGTSPAWSPSGDLLALESITCVAGYSYPPDWPPPPVCTRTGLAVVRYDGTLQSALSSNGADRNPAWSPDGEVIAFDRDRQLRLIRIINAQENALSVPALSATQPTWSPDGAQIAFTCEVVAFNQDICVVNRDGSGFRRLTSDPNAESDPDWSPDGTRIAFTSYRTGREELAVMTPDGSDVRHIVSGSAADWSPDGSKLVFVITGLGLATVNADGSGLTILSRQGEYAPSWRK
jgi:hypothetical protein